MKKMFEKPESKFNTKHVLDIEPEFEKEPAQEIIDNQNL